MAYLVIWEPEAQAAMRKLDKAAIEQISKKVLEMAGDPHHFLSKLVGIPLYRLRAGDYRLFVLILDSKKEVHILRISHRKNAYK